MRIDRQACTDKWRAQEQISPIPRKFTTQSISSPSPPRKKVGGDSSILVSHLIRPSLARLLLVTGDSNSRGRSSRAAANRHGSLKILRRPEGKRDRLVLYERAAKVINAPASLCFLCFPPSMHAARGEGKASSSCFCFSFALRRRRFFTRQTDRQLVERHVERARRLAPVQSEEYTTASSLRAPSFDRVSYDTPVVQDVIGSSFTPDEILVVDTKILLRTVLLYYT